MSPVLVETYATPSCDIDIPVTETTEMPASNMLEVTLLNTTSDFGSNIKVPFDVVKTKSKYVEYDIAFGRFHVMKSGEYNIFLWGTVLRKDIGTKPVWIGKWLLRKGGAVLAESDPQKSSKRSSLSGGIAAQLRLEAGEWLEFLFTTDSVGHFQVSPEINWNLSPNEDIICR